MLLKILFVVSCLCLVQGSYVDSEIEENGVTNYADAVLSRSRRSCGAGECNRHCIKLGHARGVCIGTYCQCRSRRRRSLESNPENGIKENEQQVNLEVDNNPVVTNFADAVLSRSRRSCGAGECNQHCIKLGHARGVCIGTYCQCRSRRRRSLENEIKENEQQVNLEVDNKPGASSLADISKSRQGRSTCSYDGCNAFCRKLGHARGVCIGTYCQCRFRRRRSAPQEPKNESIQEVKNKNEESKPKKEKKKKSESGATNLSEAIQSQPRRKCGEAECSLHCIKMGYKRGVCIGTRCQCREQ